MICLTGDIHHNSLGTGNQAACDITEIQVCQRYLSLLEERNIKVTFFISGKSFEEEWEDLKPIVHHPLVSVQGHNWSCFTPTLFHRISKKLFGSYNGPEWYQIHDLKKTSHKIHEMTGMNINCWRNHMYMHGPNTDRILANNGIQFCSDEVKRFGVPYRDQFGLVHVPINIIPDHEHLYHAERTRDWVKKWQKRYNWSDDFGSASYEIEEWTALVLEQLADNEKRGILSTLIIHPITMYLADRFDGVKSILDYIAEHQTIHMNELKVDL